ncbi:MAG: hypothetical protein ACJKSS_03065 [Patescibacteria group bacterium UBA2103]
MRKTLHEIRQKPEHVRKKYAYTSAAAISLSIFMIWGVTMVVAKPLAYKPVGEQESNTHPISDLANTFQAGFAGAAASFEDLSQEAPGQYEGEARLEIVETDRSSTIEEKERDTVLTF